MDYLIICLVAALVSGLTLFSGFGLGTLLMPAFALFFPLPVAVAATAVVHLANNLFKVGLVGRHAEAGVVLRFALPGAAAAILGAWTLGLFAGLPPVAPYSLAGELRQVTWVKLVIGVIIVGFAFFELLPAAGRLAFERRYLPLGGALSGFFGGLSGNQGALRSAFLIKLGLSKEAFIGTGVVSAVFVDLSRVLVYGLSFFTARFEPIETHLWLLVVAASLSAFLGAILGARLMKKVTLRGIQIIIGAMLLLVGAGMAAGIL